MPLVVEEEDVGGEQGNVQEESSERATSAAETESNRSVSRYTQVRCEHNKYRHFMFYHIPWISYDLSGALSATY